MYKETFSDEQMNHLHEVNQEWKAMERYKIYPPNKTQVRSAVKGHDIRSSKTRFSWLYAILALVAFLCFVYVVLRYGSPSS